MPVKIIPVKYCCPEKENEALFSWPNYMVQYKIFKHHEKLKHASTYWHYPDILFLLTGTREGYAGIEQADDWGLCSKRTLSEWNVH